MFTKETEFRDVVKKAVGIALEDYITGKHALHRVRGQLSLIRSWRAVREYDATNYQTFNFKNLSEKEIFLEMINGDLDGLVKGDSLYQRTYNTCMYLSMWVNDQQYKEKEDATLTSGD